MRFTGKDTLSKIEVVVQKGLSQKTTYTFTRTFHIGRNPTCDVQLMDLSVSRFHATLFQKDRSWWIKDFGSVNGIYINGSRIREKKIGARTRIRVGLDGPVIDLHVLAETKTMCEKDSVEALFSTTHYPHHYFIKWNEESTVRILSENCTPDKKRTLKPFPLIFWGMASFMMIMACCVGYQSFQMRTHRRSAEEIFYSIKKMEIDRGSTLKTIKINADLASIAFVENSLSEQKKLEKSYDAFVRFMNVYGKQNQEERRIIMKVARSFGECDLTIPREFYSEVLRYIDIWRSTSRLETAVNRARENGYILKIKETLEENDLPVHFFYLALQESNFDIDACGRKTRFGIAKGLWQFMPATAEKYGLRVGPFADQPVPDPKDDRHHFGRSTHAAVRYLKDIYSTDAQASGLLVMASYNWGERRVMELIRGLPQNPKDRNFWTLFMKNRDRVPKETYNYVMSVFSAAVIGENPRLFGFNFENPLSLPQEDLLSRTD